LNRRTIFQTQNAQRGFGISSASIRTLCTAFVLLHNAHFAKNHGRDGWAMTKFGILGIANYFANKSGCRFSIRKQSGNPHGQVWQIVSCGCLQDSLKHSQASLQTGQT
jgi:hypothetical protein